MTSFDKIPIDVVYTWVDLSDPVWAQKYVQTIGTEPLNNRYGNFGELYVSIQTVRRFAPFVRKIFVVTDDQIPPEFDPAAWKVTIISHKTILGSECCYPTFKSNSIEAYLHKIPGLSEYFWYFNDDTFLGYRIEKRDLFYVNGAKTIPLVDLYPKQIKIDKPPPQKEAWRWAIYNTHNIMYQKFKRHYRYSFTHQATLMSKTACKTAWSLFRGPLKKSVATPLRKPFKNTIHFVLLSQLVALEKGLLKPRTRFIFKMVSYNVRKPKNAKSSFKSIQKSRPHFFCLNDLTPYSAPYFHSFAKKFLGKSYRPPIIQPKYLINPPVEKKKEKKGKGKKKPTKVITPEPPKVVVPAEPKVEPEPKVEIAELKVDVIVEASKEVEKPKAKTPEEVVVAESSKKVVAESSKKVVAEAPVKSKKNKKPPKKDKKAKNKKPPVVIIKKVDKSKNKSKEVRLVKATTDKGRVVIIKTQKLT